MLVLPLHGCADVHQQLHQPIHLRRQVSTVPDRRQTKTISMFIMQVPWFPASDVSKSFFKTETSFSKRRFLFWLENKSDTKTFFKATRNQNFHLLRRSKPTLTLFFRSTTRPIISFVYRPRLRLGFLFLKTKIKTKTFFHDQNPQDITSCRRGVGLDDHSSLVPDRRQIYDDGGYDEAASWVVSKFHRCLKWNTSLVSG